MSKCLCIWIFFCTFAGAKVLSKIRRNDMGKILNIGKADFEQVRRFEYVGLIRKTGICA